MSEDAATAEAAVKSTRRRPLRMRPATERAVREALERIKQRLPPNYKEVAARHGVSWRALKEAVFKVKKGLMHLGLPETVEEIQVDAAVEEQRGMKLCMETAQLLHASWEAALRQFRTAAPGKEALAVYREVGLPAIVSDAIRLERLKSVKQQNFVKLLAAANREKEVKAAVADVESTVQPMDPMGEEARAMFEVQRELERDGAEQAPSEAASAA